MEPKKHASKFFFLFFFLRKRRPIGLQPSPVGLVGVATQPVGAPEMHHLCNQQSVTLFGFCTTTRWTGDAQSDQFHSPVNANHMAAAQYITVQKKLI